VAISGWVNFVFSYGCEKWFLTLREKYKLQVFRKNIKKIFIPTRDEVTEKFRILHNEELCDLYRSASSFVGFRQWCISIERILLLDFIHCLVSQEQTKLRN
jgi:hypothetical protein